MAKGQMRSNKEAKKPKKDKLKASAGLAVGLRQGRPAGRLARQEEVIRRRRGFLGRQRANLIASLRRQ